jgi:hypothetical protein
MASPTRQALADRAIRAANLIEFWWKKFETEMNTQSVSRAPGSNETVTLNAEELTAMFTQMDALAKEIRGFERKLTNQKITPLDFAP